MKRAYLDQKDYLRMAAGLGGDARYARDAEVFEKLTAHVQAGELTVYFSWAHFVEALRFRGENTTTLQRYCEVADGLTQGNCIVLHHELLEAELERFLSSRFGFQPSHSAAYAYGKWADALGKQDETPDPFIYLRERMSALIEGCQLALLRKNWRARL
jgi:hypothetical protein